MAARKRKRYSNEQRATILATASREGLTATDVKKRFGVTPVTYYSWRKKSGAGRRRGRRAGGMVMAAAAAGGDLASTVRSAVAQRVRTLIPEIVRGEVNQFLDTLLGQASGPRRGRPPGRRRRRRRRVIRAAKAKS